MLQGAGAAFAFKRLGATEALIVFFSDRAHMEAHAFCVEACPEHSPREADTKAINMAEKAPSLESDRAHIAFFEKLPVNDCALVDFGDVRGVQFLNSQLDHLRQLEDAGAGAIVLPSLFQEQIEADDAAHDVLMGAHANNSPEVQTYFPPSVSGPYGLGPDRYMDLVHRSREAVSMPVIASLNGSSKAGWVEYSELLEQAGAMAIELNMYHIPTDLLESGAQIEARYTGIVAAVCAAVAVPVSIKLTPHLSAIGHFAVSLIERGAAGLVLFNRLLQPDMDLVKLRLADTLELSTASEMRLPLLWTAILAGRTNGGSIATATGITGSDDVIKAILAGADAVMTTSALLRGGVGAMTDLVGGLQRWMDEREFANLDDMRGIMSWQRSKDRSVYTRANYLRILERYAHS